MIKNYVRFLPVYRSLLKIKTSYTSRYFLGFLNRLRIKVGIVGKRPIIIDVSGKMGLGAVLSHTAAIINYFSKFDCKVQIISSNPLYSSKDHPDVLKYLFDKTNSGEIEKGLLIPYRFYQDISRENLFDNLLIEDARLAFFSHFKPKEEFRKEIDVFFDKIPRPIIGVHFRGTDKAFETSRIDWERFAKITDRSLVEFSARSIFVTTDEEAFLKFMTDRFGSSLIHSMDVKHYGSKNVGIHFSGGNPLELLNEAFQNILALSKCDYCVRGSSYFSSWAAVFNKDLRTFTIEADIPNFNAFAERELAEKSRFYFPDDMPRVS